MGFISTFMTNEKEFTALAKELQAIRDRLDQILGMIESKSIRSEAALSMILEKESITQDKYDELIGIIRDYGKKRGLDKD